MLKRFNKAFAIVAISFTATACASSGGGNERQLTVGLVQKEIKVGVSAVKVAQTLGSPNIVKKSPDSEGEIWIYDRISQTQNDANIGISVLGLGSDISGLLGGSASSSESSSRSLTVIVKLDEKDMVKDVSYFRSAY